jgi:hypothetical protein
MTVPEQPTATPGESDAAPEAAQAPERPGGIPGQPSYPGASQTLRAPQPGSVPPAQFPAGGYPPQPPAGRPQYPAGQPQYPYNQQYPQYGAYPYPYGYPPPQPGTNGLAIAAMVCGICGFLCAVPGLVGVILGIISLPQIKRSQQSGRGMAIAGIVVGSLWILAVILLIVLGHHGQQIGNSGPGGDGSGDGTAV